LAEIVDGQANKPVATRFELHPLELLSRAALVLGARARQAVQLLNATGEMVAAALELGHVEHPRTSGIARCGSLGAWNGNERKGLGDDVRKLALEPGDLPLQRGSGGALGFTRVRRRSCGGALIRASTD
jgi:hypothetical protein